MMSILSSLSVRFSALYDCFPTTLASAPGRVNLIGEHTDYNGGFVLPTAIPQRTFVAIHPTEDGLVQVHSQAFCEKTSPLTYRLGEETRRGDWSDFASGVTWVLRDEGYSARLKGVRVAIDSEVPVGSGLSSSAALLVCLLRGLRVLLSLPLSENDLARLARRAEVEFVGAPVGYMDQLACALCDAEHALLLDTQNLQTECILIPDRFAWIVVHSGVTHNHAAGDYKTRKQECELAAQMLRVPSLRALSVEDLPRAMALPPPLGKRVRHVVTENARVLSSVAALRSGDARALGRLFSESHASMRDDYEVSVRAVDELVECAQRDPAVLGARLTGGGFGGSVVMLTKPEESQAAAERIAREYQAKTGLAPTVLVPPITIGM